MIEEVCCEKRFGQLFRKVISVSDVTLHPDFWRCMSLMCKTRGDKSESAASRVLFCRYCHAEGDMKIIMSYLSFHSAFMLGLKIHIESNDIANTFSTLFNSLFNSDCLITTGYARARDFVFSVIGTITEGSLQDFLDFRYAGNLRKGD
jgi:hypothetical protein